MYTAVLWGCRGSHGGDNPPGIAHKPSSPGVYHQKRVEHTAEDASAGNTGSTKGGCGGPKGTAAGPRLGHAARLPSPAQLQSGEGRISFHVLQTVNFQLQ